MLTRSLWLLTVDDSAVQTGKTQPFTHSSYFAETYKKIKILVVKALIRPLNSLDLNPFSSVVHIKITKYIFKQDIISNDVYVHSRSLSVSSASVHKAADFSLSPSALSARPSSFTFCFFVLFCFLENKHAIKKKYQFCSGILKSNLKLPLGCDQQSLLTDWLPSLPPPLHLCRFC